MLSSDLLSPLLATAQYDRSPRHYGSLSLP